MIIKCPFITKCGEGEGDRVIQLGAACHPTYGLLIVPTTTTGVPLSATLVAREQAYSRTVIIDRLPVDKFKVQADCPPRWPVWVAGLFREGAYYIRFPRTLNMSRIDGAELTLEGAGSSTFKIFNLHTNFLHFLGGRTGTRFAN